MAELIFNDFSKRNRDRGLQQDFVDQMWRQQNAYAANKMHELKQNDPQYIALEDKATTKAGIARFNAYKDKKLAMYRSEMAALQEVEVAPLLARMNSNTVVPESGDYFVGKENIQGIYPPNKVFADPYMAEKVYREMGYLNIYNELFEQNANLKSGQAVNPFVYEPQEFGSTIGDTALREGVANIKSRPDGNRLAVWDLETFGTRYSVPAKNRFTPSSGRNLGAFITEFSFSDITGEFGNINNVQVNDTWNSIIGIDRRQYNEFEELINKFEKGQYLTNEEKVTLERLALHGNKKTKVVKNGHFDGVYRFDDFAEKKDLSFTPEEMRKGNKLLFDIGTKQSQSLVTYNGKKMLGWEAELLSGLEHIQKEGLTALGHNTTNFDYSHLTKFLYHGLKSKDAIKMAQTLVGNPNGLFKSQLDTLMVGRNFVNDRVDFMRQLFSSMGVTDKSKIEAHIKDLSKWMRKNQKYGYGGATEFTQEALAHAMELAGLTKGGKLQDVAHTAIQDAIADAKILFAIGGMDPDNPNTFYKNKGFSSREITRGQVYTAISADDALKKGLNVFSINPITGAIETNDKISIAKNGATNSDLVSPAGIVKRGAYKILKTGAVSPDNKMFKGLNKLNGDFTGLSYITLELLTDSSVKDPTAKQIISVAGDKATLQNYFNVNMRYGGIWDENGQRIVQDDLTQAEKEQLKLVSIADPKRVNHELGTVDGKTRHGHTIEHGQVKEVEGTSDELLKQSGKAWTNEKAARINREHNLKKDVGLFNYIQELDNYAAKNNQTVDEARESFLELLTKNTDDYAQKVSKTTKGHIEPPPLSFQALFGFGTDKVVGGQKIGFGQAYYTTIRGELDREAAMRANLPIYQRLMQESGGISLSNAKRLDMAAKYQMMWNTLEAYVEDYEFNESASLTYTRRQTAERKAKARLGYHAVARNINELKRNFAIDVSGFGIFKDSREARPITFSMSPAGTNVYKSILTKLGEKNVDGMDSSVAVQKLKELQDFLIENKRLEFAKEAIIDVNSDTVAQAGQKFIHAAQAARKLDPYAGMLKATTEQIVNAPTGASRILIGMSPEQKNAILDEVTASANRLHIITIDKQSTQKINQKAADAAKIAVERISANLTPYGFDTYNRSHKAMIEQLTKKFHYSAIDAATAVKSYEIHARDLTSKYTSFFEAVFNNNGKVFLDYDEKGNQRTGRIFVGFGKGELQEVHLPKLGFQGGTLNAIIGNNETSKITGLGVYAVGKKGQEALAFGSPFIKSGYSAKYMDDIIRRGLERGDVDSVIHSILKSFNRPYQKAVVKNAKDATNTRNAMLFDYNDVIAHIDQLADTQAIQDIFGLADENDVLSTNYVKKMKEIVYGVDENGNELDLFGGKEKAMANLSPAHQQTILRFQGDIIAALKEKFQMRPAEELALFDNISFFDKHAAKGKGAMSQDFKAALEGYQMNSTMAAAKAAHAAPIEKSRAERILGGELKWGDALSTDYERNEATRLKNVTGKEAESVIRGTRLTISTHDARILGQEYSDSATAVNAGEDTKRLVRQFFDTISTDENAGALNPLTADAALGGRSTVQRVKLKELETDASSIQDLVFKDHDQRHAPIMKIVKEKDPVTGKSKDVIRFEYSNGVLVYSSQVIMHKEGYARTMAVRARDDGMLKLQIFKDNHLVSAKKINELLNSNELQNEIVQAYKTSKATSKEGAALAKALDILSARGYSIGYQVNAVNATSNVKFMNEYEKVMGNIFAVGLGINNDYKIGSFLEKARLSGLKGAQLSRDVIDELLTNNGKANIKGLHKTAFAQIALNSFLREASTDEVKKYKNNVKGFVNDILLGEIKGSFGNIEAFHKAVLEERYSAFNSLSKFLIEERILKKGQRLDAIVNSTDGIIKHGDIARDYANLIANLMDEDVMGKGKALSADDIVKEFTHGFDAEVYLRNGNGKLLDENGKEIKDEERRIKKAAKAMQHFEAALPGLTVKDGKIVFDNSLNSDDINVKSLQAIADKYGLDEKTTKIVKTKNGEITANVSIANFRTNENIDRARITHLDKDGRLINNDTEPVKIDRRMIDNYLSNRYSVSLIDNAEKKYSDILGQQGKDIWRRYIAGHYDSSGNYISHIEEKEVKGVTQRSIKKSELLVNKALVTDVIEHMFQTPGEAIITENAGDKKLGGKTENEAFKQLLAGGYTRDQIFDASESMISIAEKYGVHLKGVSADKIAATISADSFLAAHTFNGEIANGKHKDDAIDKLLKRGFVEKNIADVDVHATTAGHEASILGKATILDLNSEQVNKKLGLKEGEQLFSESERYLALPLSSLKWLEKDSTDQSEGEVTLSNLERKLRTLVDMNDEIASSKDPLSLDKRQEKAERMRNLASEIRSDISALAGGKHSIAREIERAAYGDTVKATAQAHIFTGEESKNSFWGKLEFEGVNLTDLAKKQKGKKTAIDIGYIVIGKNVANAWFGDDYISQITENMGDKAGKVKEALMEHLKTKGTLASDIRYPTNYTNSLSASALYVSDELGDEDKVYTSERQWLAKKGDWDSDKINALLHRQKLMAKVNGVKQEMSLDYGTYQVLSSLKDDDGKAIVDFQYDDEARQKFDSAFNLWNGIKKNIFTTAVNVNPFARLEISNNGAGKVFDILERSVKYSWDGSGALTKLDVQYTASEHLMHQQNYNALMDEYINSHINDVDEKTKKHLFVGDKAKDYEQFIAMERDADKAPALRQELKGIAERLYEGTGDTSNPESNKYIASMIHHSVSAAQLDMANASLGNAAAGLADHEMFKMFRVLNHATDSAGNLLFDGDQAFEYGKVRIGMQESTLTAKSERNVAQALDNISKLHDVNSNLLMALQGNSSEARKEALDAWKEHYTRVLSGRNELKELPERLQVIDAEGNLDKAGTAKKLVDDVAEMFNSLSTKNMGYNYLQQFTGEGYSEKGALWVNKNLTGLDLTSTVTESLREYAKVSDVPDLIRDSLGPQAARMSHASMMAQEAVGEILQEGNNAVSEAVNNVGDSAIQEGARNFKGIANAISHFAPHGKIGAAFSIAAGLAASGFASGPMKNIGPQDQARYAPQMEPAPAPVPALSDSNLNAMRGAPNKSYVININAQTRGGRDAAINAINQAVNTSTPQGSSTNISVNTSTSAQISQFQIGRMIQNAMGL